jgi:hypothetical protein
MPIILGWLCAATFFLGGLMTILLNYDISAPAPTPLPKGRPNLLTGTVLFFANERERWTQEVISTCLFAAGFVALVGLAIVLSRRSGVSDSPGALMIGVFVIGSSLGVGSGLLSLGAEQVALNSEICDCKYSATQIISEGRALSLAQGSSDWLLYGFLALAAIGFALATVSGGREDMSRGWRILSGTIAILFVVGLVASTVGASDLNDLIVGIGGGILIPLWAIWTGRSTRRIMILNEAQLRI